MPIVTLIGFYTKNFKYHNFLQRFFNIEIFMFLHPKAIVRNKKYHRWLLPIFLKNNSKSILILLLYKIDIFNFLILSKNPLKIHEKID